MLDLFHTVDDRTQTIAWQHEIINTVTDIKLHTTVGTLNNKNNCSNILKTQLMLCKREILNSPNNRRSEYIY